MDLSDANCTAVGELEDFLASIGSLVGDIDGDGTVDFPDFLRLADNFGASGSYTDGVNARLMPASALPFPNNLLVRSFSLGASVFPDGESLVIVSFWSRGCGPEILRRLICAPGQVFSIS